MTIIDKIAKAICDCENALRGDIGQRKGDEWIGYINHAYAVLVALEEMEVTPEMIEAGADYLRPLLREGEDSELVAKEVFEAMMRAHANPHHVIEGK